MTDRVFTDDRTRSVNSDNLQEGKIRLDMRKNFLTVKAVKH